MALTNSSPTLAIIYASVTGNTEQLANMVHKAALAKGFRAELYAIEDFPLTTLSKFNVVLIGTYTWGSGEIPEELRDLYRTFETLDKKELQTAVFGTGDSFFAEFCGAVDRFRDMLYVHTKLVATLKVELMPQPSDSIRCEKLIELIKVKRMQMFSSENHGYR
ncbi:flavodoxin [Planococcus sp. CPCC 101016]|uniref:flavodoxin domain-containing protein n=1 Tax=Planococcus sp. CPCC 101016 TaxID=2599617 RepID=UPI0011B66DA8|nr:flavodoxin domain-containing protein [Planococcus sp. CPCC 101016]TWT06416.1 flavodoxin [Planococcus sp. CPCC 101016]